MTACCRFGASLNRAHSTTPQPWDEVLVSGTNFIAVPTLGALIEGWVLIVPRQHCLCVGALCPELLEELRDFRSHVQAMMEIEYGPVIAFEHGPARSGHPAGCGVDHAHLHLLPWRDSWKMTVATHAPVAVNWRRAHGLEHLSSIHRAGVDYLYFEESDGEAWAATSDEIPSQFFRKVVAAATDQHGSYDWKTFSGEENVRATVRTLRNGNATSGDSVAECQCI